MCTCGPVSHIHQRTLVAPRNDNCMDITDHNPDYDMRNKRTPSPSHTPVEEEGEVAEVAVGEVEEVAEVVVGEVVEGV